MFTNFWNNSVRTCLIVNKRKEKDSCYIFNVQLFPCLIKVDSLNCETMIGLCCYQFNLTACVLRGSSGTECFKYVVGLILVIASGNNRKNDVIMAAMQRTVTAAIYVDIPDMAGFKDI